MDGEGNASAVAAYLSRLMGQAISQDTPVKMRSVHRAAFASWARMQNLPVRLAAITSDTSFTVREILLADAADAPKSAALAVPAASTAATGAVMGIGIDIEEVAALPEADDYREHPFFQDNFTSAEIAYCVRRPDVRASFCGTWAAKEAYLKSGMLSSSVTKLNMVEVGRDAVGRPTIPGCSISISHVSTMAVAVCVATGTAPPIQETEIPITVAATEATPRTVAARGRTMAAACAFAIIVGGVLSFALHAWP